MNTTRRRVRRSEEEEKRWSERGDGDGGGGGDADERDGPGGVTVASVNAEDALETRRGREGGWIRVRGGEHDAGDW